MRGRCPPGVFCITPTLVVLVVGVMIAVCILIMRAGAAAAAPAPVAPALAPVPETLAPTPIAIQIAAANGNGGDDRYTRAPKPERHWITMPEIPTSAELYGKLPRIPTRGMPESYQSMGVIKMDDGSLLPLYGRRTAARSDRFQYYTRTDTYNPVQLPLSYKRRDCQDDIGCEELFSGESVTVQATNQKGVANIYRFDGPTYVP
jgi:hypothetical protein